MTAKRLDTSKQENWYERIPGFADTSIQVARAPRFADGDYLVYASVSSPRTSLGIDLDRAGVEQLIAQLQERLASP
jgi:hypothetical protein